MVALSAILVPVDLSPCSAAAIRYASHLAAHHRAWIDALHIVQFEHRVLWMGPEGPERAVELATDNLCPGLRAAFERWIDRIRSPRGVHPHLRFRLGDAVEEILGVAAEGYDLVVLGQNGRPNARPRTCGEVAQAVVARSPCRCITVPSQAPIARRLPPLAHATAESERPLLDRQSMGVAWGNNSS